MFGEIEADQWWWPLDCEDWIGQRRRRCKAVGSRLHQMYRIIHTDNFQWSPAKGQILFPHKILSRIYTWSRGIWQPSPHCLIYFFRFFVISKRVVSLLVSLNIVVEAVMIRPMFWVDANLCGIMWSRKVTFGMHRPFGHLAHPCAKIYMIRIDWLRIDSKR